MKTTILKLVIIIFLATITTSCGVDMFNKVDGNRNVVIKDRKLNTNFTAIKVSSGLDLYITQGDENSLTVEADENLHDIILTEVENGRLRIYTKKGIWRAKARKIHVTVKNLEELEASSGSDVYSENTILTNTFKVNVSSGADVKIKVNAESVNSTTSSGSDLKIMGTTENHTANASSGSSIDAYNLTSKNVTVNVNSGADINIFASENLNANANSGGDIDYRGNPKVLNKKSSSGGSISAK